MELTETRTNNLYPVKESAHTSEWKYFYFHKSHDHNTKNCIHLKEVIEGLIKKGQLSQYTKDKKRDWEDSAKRNYPPNKTIEVVARGKCKVASREDVNGHKGKHQYITSITRVSLRLSNPSKRKVKRNIEEPMVVRKKEGNTYTKSLKRYILEFWDN